MSNHPLYQVWRNMKARCYEPRRKDYPNYGGRGITVCRAWLTSDNFFAWAKSSNYVPGLTIERRDNNKNYTASNCYWGTRRVQTRNRRITLRVDIGGKSVPLIEACDVYGVLYKTVMSRMHYGWPMMEALTSPVGQHVKRHKTVGGVLVGKS